MNDAKPAADQLVTIPAVNMWMVAEFFKKLGTRARRTKQAAPCYVEISRETVMDRLETTFRTLAIVHGDHFEDLDFTMEVEREYENQIEVSFCIRGHRVFALGCNLIEDKEVDHFMLYSLMFSGEMSKPRNWGYTRTIYEIADAVFKLCADTVEIEKYETTMFD